MYSTLGTAVVVCSDVARVTDNLGDQLSPEPAPCPVAAQSRCGTEMTRPDNGGDVRHAADWRVTGLGNEQSEGKHARPIGCGLGGGPVYSEYLGEFLS